MPINCRTFLEIFIVGCGHFSFLKLFYTFFIFEIVLYGIQCKYFAILFYLKKNPKKMYNKIF